MNDTILILIIILLPLTASILVQSKYNKYSKTKNIKGLSGFDVARSILDKNGLDNILIVETAGNLTDHYDPRRKVIRLSSNIYHSESIAALAVAAHETCHAIQDKEGYFFLKFRNFIYPVVNLCSRFSYVVILLGFILGYLDLIYLGIALVGAGLIFQLITLPVEFNASNEAMVKLKKYNLTTTKEDKEVKAMLSVAAWTYVAGALATLAQMLRLFGMTERK